MTSLDMTSNFHSRAVAEGANYVRYRNPEMDRLIEQAASQPDMLAEKPYLDQIQRLVPGDEHANLRKKLCDYLLDQSDQQAAA